MLNKAINRAAQKYSFCGTKAVMKFSTGNSGSNKPDVCIVGGGPAGVALACTLA